MTFSSIVSSDVSRSVLVRRLSALLAGLIFSTIAFAAPQIQLSAIKQIDAIKAIKSAKTATQNKIGSRLYMGLLHQRKDARVSSLTNFRFVRGDVDGKVPVEIVLSSANGMKPALNQLETLGDTVTAKSLARRVVSARVHLADLETLAAIPQVQRVREAIPGMTQKINTSQGDSTHGADEARPFFGVTGFGVKVCVLSNGVDSLASIQASGDLPPSVDVLAGQAGSGDEGTAMLEIVHDLAPGAALGFAQAGPDEAGFAQNILDLATAGCNIIVDDDIYLDESPFEDGPVAQSVNTVTAAGVIYFSSAGNEGNMDDATSGTWEGDFHASAATVPPVLDGVVTSLHDFGDGGNSILINSGNGSDTPPVLIWAEHYNLSTGLASTDFDLYDMDGGLTAVFDASNDTQDGTGGDDYPVEFISGGSFTGERLLIDKFASGTTSSTPMFNLILFRGVLDANLATSGATRGHSAAVAAFSVAATPAAASFDGISPDGPFPGLFTSANASEDFTSDGPRRLILDGLTGNELTPGNRTSTGGIVRQKPDITAADGVSTATPGFNPFYGTSAAAPHAAAIAALLKSAVPGLTQAQVRTALVSTAIDIETAGVDHDTGAGIVMAHAALASINAVPQAAITMGTAVPSQSIGDGDAYVEPNEIWNLSIPLTNPGGASATGISAVLSTSTPGVTITSANSAYPDLASGASANNTTPFAFRIASDASCGTLIDFTLTVTFAGGPSPQTFTFTVQTGEPGAVSDFSYSGAAVPIPDGVDLTGTNPGAAAVAPLTVSGFSGFVYNATMSIDGDTCTTDVGATTVGIDHSFVNDLQISLIAPDNTTVSVIHNTDGGGNNFCKTVLDDSAATSIQSVATTQAPFTGTFAPNSPLAVLHGKNPNGTWKLQAQDFFQEDTGNIRAFSVHITPAVCNAPPLVTSITGTKTVSGIFNPGQTVTYTVTLSNSGNLAQADNAGHEFTDVLPASLTLVNATATSGTAAATIGTNTATWDGTIPAAGSVTITITATINAVANGTMVSNQGAISFDSSATGTNDSSAMTDDPSVGGAADPTVFTVVIPPTPVVTGTKTITGGNETAGGTVVYSVVLTNSGNATQADNPGNEFADVLPGGLTLTNVTATSGTAAAAIGTNTVTWNGSIASGASVTITITASINAGTAGQTISNTGNISYDSDGNGTNDASATTNGPGGGPTTFVVLAAPAPVIAATKTISGGNKTEGGNVVYQIVLTNSGAGAQNDNVGPEFSDQLPLGLLLGDVTATSGAVSKNVVARSMEWDGSIPAGGSVTITISATIQSGFAGQTISNQGIAEVDTDGDGTNETGVLTSDPSVAGAISPTSFVVLPRATVVTTIPAPTLSLSALILGGLLLAGIAMADLKRRSRIGIRRR